MKLCDLHTHVLPGVDDGAPNLGYALQMLENAAASDVALLAVTPHCNRGDAENFLDQNLKDRFLQLQAAAKALPIQLVLGAEVLADRQLPQLLRQGKLPTLNGSRYLLTEFPPFAEADAMTLLLQDILSQGYVPLVAHPERYAAVCREPRLVLSWLDLGCHVQLSGGSLQGEYGKTVQQTAKLLLQNDLVACIGSDAHGLHHRSNFLLPVYDHLSVRYSKGYAQCLMWENPMAICRNEEI